MSSVTKDMRVFLPIVLLTALACSSAPGTPSSVVDTPPPAGSGSPSAAPSPEPEAPRDFPAVSDAGLVTLQDMRLHGEPFAREIRVGMDGRWKATLGTTTREGTLTEAELTALRDLAQEASETKPTETAGLPCDALPVHATRLTFPGQRAVGWSGPCAGPPPPEPNPTLAKVLVQIAEGKSKAEIEKTLAPRPR